MTSDDSAPAPAIVIVPAEPRGANAGAFVIEDCADDSEEERKTDHDEPEVIYMDTASAPEECDVDEWEAAEPVKPVQPQRTRRDRGERQQQQQQQRMEQPREPLLKKPRLGERGALGQVAAKRAAAAASASSTTPHTDTPGAWVCSPPLVAGLQAVIRAWLPGGGAVIDEASQYPKPLDSVAALIERALRADKQRRDSPYPSPAPKTPTTPTAAPIEEHQVNDNAIAAVDEERHGGDWGLRALGVQRSMKLLLGFVRKDVMGTSEGKAMARLLLRTNGLWPAIRKAVFNVRRRGPAAKAAAAAAAAAQEAPQAAAPPLNASVNDRVRFWGEIYSSHSRAKQVVKAKYEEHVRMQAQVASQMEKRAQEPVFAAWRAVQELFEDLQQKHMRSTEMLEWRERHKALASLAQSKRRFVNFSLLQPAASSSVGEPAGADDAPIPQWVRALHIVHLCDGFLAVDKPAELKVHGKSNLFAQATLNEALGLRFPALQDNLRNAHQLDRATSGLIVYGLSQKTAAHACKQFEARTTTKIYAAIVRGHVGQGRGGVRTHIRMPIARAPKGSAQLMIVGTDAVPGKSAETVMTVLARGMFGGQAVSKVQLEPKSGRTHQLRVHMQAFGHPIVGDEVYAGDDGAYSFGDRDESGAAAGVVSGADGVGGGVARGGAMSCATFTLAADTYDCTAFGTSPRMFLHAWKLQLNLPKRGQVTLETTEPFAEHSHLFRWSDGQAAV